MVTGFSIQDTTRPGLVVKINAGRLIPDSIFRRLDEKPAHILKAERERLRRKEFLSSDTLKADTTSVSMRNSIADVTFSDSLSFIKKMQPYTSGSIPFKFTKKSGTEPGQYRPLLIRDLRTGTEPAGNPLHQDWVTILVFLSFWLFLLVRSTIRNMRPETTRFFLFRGINEPVSRDTATLFYWQSTVFNFISFLVLSLFVYGAAAYFNVSPSGLHPLITILLLFGIVSVTITLRHFVVVSAGKLSGQSDLFNEYLINIYHSYRYCSLALFFLVLLIFYTIIFPPLVSIIAGFAVMVLFYIYRVTRLFLIFIKRHISIFYLILYLCALEILPILILAKYIKEQV
jgi:hypothetical protein